MNVSLAWLDNQDNIEVDEKIKDTNNIVRGVYGIFVKDNFEIDENAECVYVGESESIYDRIFGGKGHISMLMKENHNHPTSSLIGAMNSGKKISIKILEEVPLKLDNYCKDVQRLRSAENKYIDYYHEKDQCLEQVPNGKNMSIDDWEKLKRSNKLI